MIFSWKTTFFPKTKKELNEKRWHCFTFFESFYCSAPEKTWLSCLLRLSCCGLLSDTSNVKKIYLHRDVLLERYIVTPFQITVTFPVLFHSSTGRILTSWLRWALPHPHTFHTLMATSTAALCVDLPPTHDFVSSLENISHWVWIASKDVHPLHYEKPTFVNITIISSEKPLNLGKLSSPSWCTQVFWNSSICLKA